MSGYLPDKQLRRQLEEKVEATKRTRQAAEDGLKSAQEVIDAARKIDANVVEAEKALADATSAMADKDYQRAADRAAEATERGKRIYRERVSAIIESSAGLSTLAKGVGADVAESEASLGKARDALGADNLPEAVDFAKKAWKRSEKVLSEHLSSSFSKVQALILSAKNLGRDTAAVEDLLSRARTAVEGNNFQSALDFTKEGLDTVKEDLTSAVDKDLHEAEDLLRAAQELGADVTKANTFLERARSDIANLEFEKANNAVRQCRTESEKALQRSLEGKFADFSHFIADARAIGADPSAAEGHFAHAQEALKQGNYKAGAQLAKQGFAALQDAQFQRVVATIGASREKFVAAVNLGIDLKDPLGFLGNARQALQRSAFQEAMDWAQKADDAVDRTVAQYRSAQERLKALHRSFAESEARGVETKAARRLAEVARNAYQQHDLAGLEKAVDDAHEELRKSEREEVMRTIERVEFTLTVGEQRGADLAEASKLLEDAIVATKANEHRRALDLVAQAQANAETALGKYILERMAVLRTALPHVADDAGDLKAIILRTDAALASRDFEGAFKGLDDGSRFVEDRTRASAEQLVASLGLAIQLRLDLGLPTDADEPPFREMSASLGSGHVAEVVAARDRVLTLLASDADALLGQVRTRIGQAQALRINVEEMTEYLDRAQSALGVQNYAEGLRLLKEAADRANKATALHRQAHDALSGAAAFVADARKHNVDVTKVVETLVDAKKAFERLDYAQAIELSAQAKAETEKLTVLYSSAQKILSNKERMEVASRLGIDAPHLRETATEAKEAMKAKNYPQALALASRADDEFGSLIREKIAALLTTSESIVGSVEGVNLAQVNEETIRARQALDAGEFARAADLALHLRETLEHLKKQGEEADVAIKRVRELVSDAEAMNLEARTTAALLDKAERAYKMGHFEEAMDHAAQAEVEVARERDQGIAAMMQRFEDSITRARRDGTDTRSAEKLFERSREFFRAKKYRQALATALQSEAEAERVALRQGMASQAVATIDGKLKTLGRPAPPVDRVADEARRALAAGDFVKALDLAIRASDSLADFRAAYEEAQEVRIRATALRQTARDIGAEADKLDTFIHEGDDALATGDVESARASFSQCLEWGIGLLRAHLRESLSKADELVATCRRLDIDPTAALNKLSEARTQLDGENFAVAHARIRDGQEIAQDALGARLNRTLAEAAENVAHAKKLGSDARGAEDLLRQAREQAARGEYAAALDVVGRAVEHVESAKVVEKRFIDLTFKAETTIRNGKKYGIDMRAAEKRLAESMDARRRDAAEGIKAAEEAYRLAWDAVEAFAPNLKGSLEVGPAKLNEPMDVTLSLENVGKGLAKDVHIRVLGDAEAEGLPEIPAIRAHGKESVAFRLKMTAPGSVPLAVQLISHRVFDDKEYVQETIAQVEVAEAPAERPKKLLADLESRCPICKGAIKKGFKVLQCACGRDFHELCASRVGRCPVCFRPLGNPAE